MLDIFTFIIHIVENEAIKYSLVFPDLKTPTDFKTIKEYEKYFGSQESDELIDQMLAEIEQKEKKIKDVDCEEDTITVKPELQTENSPNDICLCLLKKLMESSKELEDFFKGMIKVIDCSR